MSLPQACNNQQLVAMLNSDHEAEQFAPLLRHVEHCSRCQQQLESLAGEPQHWRQAAQLLSDFSSSDEFRSRSRTADYPRRAGDPPVEWTESMARQLLSPGAHPEMLGRIGRYEVERLIGSGGMGIVFKAFDTELNRPVAIKILAPYLAGSGAARQRFAREAKAAAAVVHEHVVPIHNVETDGQSPYLVMRFVAGESLQSRIDRLGALEVCEILRIGMQTASGLSAAHSQGLIHRDIKPSNILVESSVDRSLITDFGLARAADDASLTNTGYHPGTPQFMSPEQARGDTLDARSDLFSLGSVLYTMAAGRPPFRAETSYGILRRITDTQPRDVQEINPKIPSWLCALINKLMAKSPSDRFQSAEELSEVLSLCLAHVQRPASCRLPADVVKLDARAKGALSVQRYRKLAMGLAITAAIGATLYFGSAWIAGNLQRSTAKSDVSSSPAAGIENGSNESNALAANWDAGVSQQIVRSPKKLPPKQLGPPEPSEIVRDKLNEPTSVRLESVNLQEGVASIMASSEIGFSFNEASLLEAEIDRSRVESIDGRSTMFVMLQRFLKHYDASFIVRDASLEIVSAEYARENPVLRYYELSAVQTGNQNLAALVTAIEQCGSRDLWHSLGGPFTISHVDSMLLIKADEVTHHEIESLLSQISDLR